MHGLEVTVILGLAVLAGSVLSPRLRVPVPLLLLLIGVTLGFVPNLRELQPDPDIVLLLFLPVMLFWESLTTSLRAIRRDFRAIVLMSTVLPIATALGVAVVAAWLGMPWPAAFIVGAALAPPDATAVAALGKTLPHRNFMLLKAESLTNDGMALVLFSIALSLAQGGHVSPGHVGWLLLLSYGGGILAGLIVAGLAYLLMQRIQDATSTNVALLLVPFTAYLLAESVEASGVLGCVVAGLVLAAVQARISSAASRRQTEYAWPLGSFVLNGTLFVLVGTELQRLVHELTLATMADLAIVVVAVWLTLLVIRFAFQTLAAVTLGYLERNEQRPHDHLNAKARLVSALAGFRGGVSLAIALGVPMALNDGAPFPQRAEIIFVTSGVIVLTLFIQGPILPLVLRWADLPEEVSTDDELRYAELAAAEAASKALPDLAQEHECCPEAVERVENLLDEQLTLLRAKRKAGVSTVDELPDVPEGEKTSSAYQHLTMEEEVRQLRLGVLDAKRERIRELRLDGSIDDAVARQIQAQLDIEEVRLDRLDPLDESA